VNRRTLSRRAFVAAAAAPYLLGASKKHIPVGLELYSVREELKSDLPKTLKVVAAAGYQCVEFFSPYYEWTTDYAKGVRKQLDDLNIRCYSTHNSSGYFDEGKIDHAIELNQALGATYMVMASSIGKEGSLDGWKGVAQKLSQASKRLGRAGLKAGYHNHQAEFTPVDGVRPIEVIAKGTPHDVMLQLDVGTCLEVGSDPVAWIKQNPGRIRSLHCKDWSQAQGYKVLFGEGSAPWKQIFDAAESVGGVEFYLVEQEGSRYSELETAKRCLEEFKKVRS
jgi:sugar phosphate isomerase/epimerase